MSEESWIDEQGLTHYGSKEAYLKTQGTTINLKIDKSQAMKDLEQENENLKSKLTIIAEKEFNIRSQAVKDETKTKLGLDIDVSTPSELKAYEKMLIQKSGKSRDIPLNQAFGPKTNPDNENKSIMDRQYKTVAELMNDLDSEAKKGDITAQNAIKKIASKELGQLKDYLFEFQGEISKGNDPDQRNKWVKKRKVGL